MIQCSADPSSEQDRHATGEKDVLAIPPTQPPEPEERDDDEQHRGGCVERLHNAAGEVGLGVDGSTIFVTCVDDGIGCKQWRHGSVRSAQKE